MNERKAWGLDNEFRLNANDAPFALGVNEILNSENIRTQTTDAGVTGVVESIGSNVLISQPVPSITYLTIGTVEDTENKRFIKFQYNTIGAGEHKIVAFYEQAGTNGVEYDVLLNYQVTGGLNFSKNSPIHSAAIVNGFLVWPDSTNNQPRKINIEAAIKANNPSFVTNATPYIFPMAFSEITLIKHPPPLPAYFAKGFDNTYLNNFIANESFEFAFQYVWYDNEITVTGFYSVASRLNRASDTFNVITVLMNYFEVIPNSVRIVNLIARFSNTNNARVIKSWDKDIASEATEISNHNAQITQLEFPFYNNIVGETVPPDDVLRPYDTVPIYAEGLSAARSRLFLANNTEGYDTPTLTSLTLALGSQITLASTSHSTTLISFRYAYSFPLIPAVQYAYSGWYVYITWLPNQVGYFLVNGTNTTVTGTATYPALPAAPTSVAFSGLTYIGATQADVIASTKSTGARNPNLTSIVNTSNSCAITGTSTDEYNVFAPKMPYKAGVVFYDFAMRKCGVVTNDGIVVTTTTRNFAYTTAFTSLNWTLSNTQALTEIPDWAYWYAPVRTLNLRTRFFAASYTNAAKYATKDATGKYVFTSNLFTTSTVGIGINTAALNQAGLGYSFTEGDNCILTTSTNTTIQIPIIDQVDNFIVLKAQDIGSLASAAFMFEVYTPYQSSDQEPFWEVGQLYAILNPTTNSRQYSTLFGVFNSDAYVISRSYLGTTYFAEAMSPNDLYWQRWDNDGGKPNLITKLGQVEKTQYTRWSDTYIPNTAVNGLSTFRALNQKPVPEDCGAIMKLILTSKVEGEQGTVMLAICAGGETVSLYMQETQLTDNNGNTIGWAQTAEVIGQMNVLKGNKGTINPESVCEYRGDVWWFDANNGQWIQYSLNGLDVISEYKMTRFWNLWAKKYLSMTAAEIEAFGGRPFVFSIVDTQHKELLISIPKLSDTPPKGYLPDYPQTIFPFDILDFQATTIVYKLGAAGKNPHWQGKFTFYAENFITLNNKLYSFKGGLTYRHNDQNSQNNFYGISYASKIMFVSNQLPNVPKVYNNISVEANVQPSFIYFYNNYPYLQSSDLFAYDQNWRNYEGVFYATLYRNKLSTGVINAGILTGEKMRNVAMYIMIEFNVSDTPLSLNFVSVGYEFSLGHTSQLNK